MDLYNKHKKKNTENHSNNQNEFGDISREIDDILNDAPKSTGSEDKYSQHENANETNKSEQEHHYNENQREEYSSESATPSNEDVYEINNDESSGTDTANQEYQSDDHTTSDYSENDEHNEMHDTTTEEYENTPSEENNNYKFELSLPKLKAEKQNSDHSSPEQWNQSNQTNSYAQNDEKKTKSAGKKMKSFSLFSKKKKQSSINDENSSSFTKEIPNTQGNTNHNMHISDGAMDEEVLKLLGITDELLGKLPEDVINEFASSKDFELYKRVMNRYKIIK